MARSRKPLVVVTPKSLLRAKEVISPLADMGPGTMFHRVIGESEAIAPDDKVRRVVLASGKVYFDLAKARAEKGDNGVALVRVEQLYPFPVHSLRDELARFPRLRAVVWAQEEAKNHGAWHLVRDQLEAALPPQASLTYAGRPPAAPSAVCNAQVHAAEQYDAVASALGT